VEDLSSLCGDIGSALIGGESMAATNSVSPNPPFTGPGSTSESTASEAVGNPGLDVGPQTNHTHRVSGNVNMDSTRDDG
jgi:hypothetical protein